MVKKYLVKTDKKITVAKPRLKIKLGGYKMGKGVKN